MTNKIQHSTKVGDAIMVVGGESWPEFSMNFIEAYGQDAFDATVSAFTAAAGGIGDLTERGIRAAQAGGLTGVNPGLNPNTSAPTTWQPQQARQQDPAPAVMCAHGPMIPRSGTKGNKPWSGHFCSAPKGAPDQCPPVWG